MIPGLHYPDQADQPRPWRAAAAADADAAATRPEQRVTELRHLAVRQSVRFLADADSLSDRQLRRDHVLAVLAASVEKQALVSGLGRHRIARLVVTT